MTHKTYISTENAPAAIGPYSQAVHSEGLVFLSGQIPLIPDSMELNNESIESQAIQVFENLAAVAKAAGGSLADTVKLNIYLSDMSYLAITNMVMERYFKAPYPARAALAVKELPQQADIEIEAILSLPTPVSLVELAIT